MGAITLPNFRTTADVTMNTRLKDGGLFIDWAGLSNIKAWLYSDAQKAIAGRCDVSIDAEAPTVLVCTYAASKPQYLGVNRLIVQATYGGRTKTYDKPAFTFVRWTADQAGEQITIDDPTVDVEIVVEDVSSSILDNIIAAALDAAARAEAAAQEAEHMVDIHRGPAGKSPYKGENGNWFEWDEEAGQYVDTGVQAKGETGDTPDISIGTVTTVEPGEPAAASMTGTPEAPMLNLSIPQGAKGDTPTWDDFTEEEQEEIAAEAADALAENNLNTEDLEKTQAGKIQLADRTYNAQQPNGLGYKILRKDATFASQVTDTNTIYEIRYDFDLDNTTVTIPSGCVLKFNGGKITNGTINCNGCYLEAPSNLFILSVNIGTFPANKNVYSAWFGFSTTNPDADILSSLLQVGLNVIVNSGVYTLTKTITKTSATLTKITGETKQREITTLSFSGCDGFDVKSIEISNFKISGDDSHKGIIINGSYVIVKDNSITQFAIGIYRSGNISSIMCVIEDNTISYCTDTGIYVQGSSSGYTGEYNIVRNYISKCGTGADNISSDGTDGFGYGVVVGGVNLFVFRYNVVEYCTCYGVFINPKYVTKGLDIEQNVFEQNKRSQIALKAETISVAGLIVNNCVSTYPLAKVSNFLKEFYYDYSSNNIFYSVEKGTYGYNHFFDLTPEKPIGFNPSVSSKYLDRVPDSGTVLISPDGYFKFENGHSAFPNLNICYLRKGQTIYVDVIFNLVAGSASEYYLVLNQGNQTIVLSRAWDADDRHNIVRITATEDGYINMINSYIAGVTSDFDYRIRIVTSFAPPYLQVTTVERSRVIVKNFAGYVLFDSTLNKLIFHNGTTWVNMDGTAL